MIIPFALILALCLWGLRVDWKNGFSDSMSPDKTASVKGFFLLVVFLSHSSQYITYAGPLDAAYGAVRGYLGQLVVVMFLFYSGYGIYRSIEQKGPAYVSRMPVQRIGKTLVHFDLAVALFLLAAALMGRALSWQDSLLALTGWISAYNSNWYIFAILWAYAIAWFSFWLLPGKSQRTGALVLATALCIGYVLLLRQWKNSYWYNTFPAFAAGLWFARYEPRWNRWMNRGAGAWLGATLALLAAFLVCHHFRELASGVLFALVLTALGRRVQVDNPALRWCGKHLFSLFILQRLPMNVLYWLGLADYSTALFLAACLALTLCLTLGFDWMVEKLDSVLFPPAALPGKAARPKRHKK